MDTVKNSVMILNFKDDGPVMFVSELADLHLCPVEPVMLAVLLGISVLKVHWFEFTLVIVVAERNDEVEVTLDQIVLDVNLHEGGLVAFTSVSMLGLVMMVVVVVAHLFKRLYLLRKDSKIYIGKNTQRGIQFHGFYQNQNKMKGEGKLRTGQRWGIDVCGRNNLIQI